MKLAILLIFSLFVLHVVNAAEVNKGLNLEEVSAVPEKLVSGANFSMVGKIRNIADRDVNDIRITVKGGFPFSKTSPLFSFYIGKLRKNEVYPFKLDLTIDKDAEAEEYPLELIADYNVFDSAVSKVSNVIYSEKLVATVKVDKGVDFEIIGITSTQKIIPDIKDAILAVNLKNTGSKLAKEIKLSLAAQYPFIPSGKSYFISELRSGETKDAIFHVDVDADASAQTYPADVLIEWKEEDVSYSKTKTFGVSVEKSPISNPLANIADLKNEYIIIAVGLIAFLLFFRGLRKIKRRAK